MNSETRLIGEKGIKMAASELDVDKIVRIFREIVKRKTSYNETNLHYEYFKRAGDTIPFKAHGFQSLRDFIQKKAGDFFYFERVAKDLEFIAPRRLDGSSMYSEPKKVTVVKKFEQCGLYGTENGKNSGCETAKRVRVSNNIYFGQPQSTGVNNPFQNIRNDIKISFDFDLKKREVDRCSTNAEKATESESSPNNEKQMAIRDDSNRSTYSSARNDEGNMDVDEIDDNGFPWDEKYWHLKITHAASTNEIWARFFDEFEDRMRKMTSQLIKMITSDPKRSYIRIGNGIYVVKDHQSYYRAVVLKVEPEINQSKCFLIDVGEVKWFEQDDIFSCPYEFRGIQPMAMRFSLYGLIEFKDNRGSSEIIVKELLNKEVWAKIKITSQEFNAKSVKHKPIPVILYDSMDRYARMNISADIMEKMVLAFKPPKLSKSRTNYVSITHISKVTGNIYCHVINSANDLKYVNSMIEALVEHGPRQYYDNFQSEAALHELLAINANKLYLVYSEYDRNWYRATILQLETDLDGSDAKNICSHCSVYCFLVDYGNTRVVNLTNVFLLPGILAQYPHLAVAMTLDGVHMTRAKIDELKTLLMTGDNVCVDVIDTMKCGDSNKTKTISLVKITKISKDNEDNHTFVCDINHILH